MHFFKISLFSLFCLLNITAFAQTAPRTWLVKDPPYSGRNHANIKVSSVELTPNNTIITFLYDNRSGDLSYITICNSFKIVANHRKIATIQKTKDIPLVDVSTGFRCANESDMPVKAGKVISFKLYFPAIPKDVEYIDLIEYNGAETCEYAVYDVDIRQKTKTNPIKKTDETSQSDLNRKRVAVNPPPKKVKPPPVVEPPVIVKPPPVEPPKEKDPIVSVQKNPLSVKTRALNIEVWDNDKEDGDIISLKLNGTVVLKNREIKKQPYKMTLTLTEGKNTLVMQAENLGTRGNNTAAIKIDDGVSPPKTVVLNSDMGHSEAIIINVEGE